MATQYDVVVIGCGPAGERAAIQAARAGYRVVVIERSQVVGGTSVNWGTIPSKTLRESALFVYAHTHQKLEGIRTEISDDITVSGFMYRERQVRQRELEIINRSLTRYRIEVVQGHARFLDPRRVAVLDDGGETRMVVEGQVIVIATGTSPNHPDDVPFDGATVFDSDTILELPQMPRSMIVLGAGVIAVEYACIFTALGLEVTMVDTRPELLPYLDREIAARLVAAMREMGTRILHGDRYESIEVTSGRPSSVRVRTQGGLELEAGVVLYSVGRDGNSAKLGLEAIGITPNERGLIPANEHYQTIQPHIYAVGDIIGYPALASTSMEQGRRAIRHAFGLSGVSSRTAVPLPFAIYSIPEVSYIGESEEAVRARGADYVVGRGEYEMNPRGQITGDTSGLLKLLFEADSMTLVGAHIVGRNASELIHLAQAFVNAGTTAEEIAETLFNYPTLSDLFRHAALEAVAACQRRA